MSKIKLVKRIKFAGDVHAALMELGWDAETAAAFLDSIPDADREEVFNDLHEVKEALEMAKQTVAPVVRCKDCKHYRTHGDIHGLCYYGTGMRFMYNDGFCSYGERRNDDAGKV